MCKLVLEKPVMPPPTPALPDYRLHCMFPFQTIGIDYAGDELFKCYFLLITSAATRAVHIELTSDFSSNLLILALRRCFARRGTASQIITDNFKTFKAVEIRDFIRFNRIQWEFILQRSPWWGRFCERLVGVIKNCLKKVVGKARLNFEELNTVIVEIEKCVNLRPLTYLSEEREDTGIIPNHLIYGRDIDRNKSVQHKFHELNGDDMRKRQAYCQVVFKHFTKPFVKEYLPALQETHSYSSHKNHSPACSLRAGDLALIKEDIIPRLSWKRGVVDQLITGHDCAVRGAIIRTKSKNTKETAFIKRPLQLIVLLEADQ